MKRIVWGVVLCVLFVHARTLSLQACIDKTLQNHPDIAALSLSLEASEQEVRSAKAPYRPQVAVHLEYDPVRTYVLPVMGKFATREDHLLHADVMLSQKIWDFSKTSHRIGAARVEKEISKLLLADLTNRLKLRVEQVYDAILLQKSLISLKTKDLRRREALYRQALAMQRQGLKTKADAARLRASVLEAREALSRAKADWRKVLNTLSFLTGEKIDPKSRFEDKMALVEALKIGDEAKKRLREMLRQNPALLMMQKEILKAQKLYRSAKAERYGSIDAVAMATHEESLSDYDTKLVALKAQVPLYAGGKLRAQIQKAKIAEARAKMQYRSLLLQYRERLEALFIDLSHADVLIAAKKESIKAAKAALDVVRARYREGLVTYLQLLDALTLYESSQVAYIGAIAKKSDLLYQIKSLTGAEKL